MGYWFTDLGAEGCCRSLNALSSEVLLLVDEFILQYNMTYPIFLLRPMNFLRLNLTATLLFVQQLVQANIKATTCMGSTGYQWFPSEQKTEGMFRYSWWVPQNKFLWCCKFMDCMSTVEELQYDSCQILDNGSASTMRSRYLISNTNYTTNWGMMFASAKMRYHENSLGSSKCSETPPIMWKTFARHDVIMMVNGVLVLSCRHLWLRTLVPTCNTVCCFTPWDMPGHHSVTSH